MSSKTKIILEICAGSVTSALAAQEGGAQRVEFCDNLLEGGTTPSYGQIACARELLHITLNVIIRPRGGDFLYTDLEYEVMKRDIELCKKLKVDGIVLGLLTADGEVDIPRTKQLVELASPLQVTFHRAFDVTRDPYRAAQDIIACGCNRLLSSGQAPSAEEGSDLLRQLNQQFGQQLIIMPGAGIRAHNIAKLIQQTGCHEFHSSGRASFPSKMNYRSERVKMGLPQQDEYSLTESSADLIRQILCQAGNKED